MDQDSPRIPATRQKNILLAIIFLPAFYFSMIYFRDGKIIPALLVLAIMSFAMYAVMIHGHKSKK